MPSTGTAQGFNIATALKYAQNWINENGGLPADAVLTYEGTLNDTPAQYQPIEAAPYPNNLEYMFTYRHGSSGLMGADRISILVDDSGSLTPTQQLIYPPRCQFYVYVTIGEQRWVPQYNVDSYVRIWRSTGQNARRKAPLERKRVRNDTTTYAYCTPDIVDPSTTATPCSVTFGATANTYTDLNSGLVTATSETFK